MDSPHFWVWRNPKIRPIYRPKEKTTATERRRNEESIAIRTGRKTREKKKETGRDNCLNQTQTVLCIVTYILLSILVCNHFVRSPWSSILKPWKTGTLHQLYIKMHCLSYLIFCYFRIAFGYVNCGCWLVSVLRS